MVHLTGSRSIGYLTVDVFTRVRFGGNPVAIIPDARDLDDAAMQSIAKEFNYSECVFVTPPADPQNTARVRIFTPTDEIPFAGHPNIGTGFALARAGTLFGTELGDRMWFEEDAGLVQVEVLTESDQIAGALIYAPRELEVGEEIATSLAAECLGLNPPDISLRQHRPVRVSVGLPFTIVELGDLAALARCKPNSQAFEKAHMRHPHPDDRFSIFAYVPCGPKHIRARMFAPLSNIPEDPATGSACAALAAFLHSRMAGSGDLSLLIEQGVEMGRRSEIEVRVTTNGNGRQQVAVSGACIPVMEGVLAV